MPEKDPDVLKVEIFLHFELCSITNVSLSLEIN